MDWVKQDLSVVKIADLLARRGVLVPYRTLHRFCSGTPITGTNTPLI